MLRQTSITSAASIEARLEAFGTWFDADVDAAISLIPIVRRLATNLERVVGKAQASQAFSQLENCDEDWHEAIERTEFYLESELGARLTGLSAYAVFGLMGDGYLSEEDVAAVLQTLEAMLLDCPPDRWLPDGDREPLLPTILMARARWNLDHGLGLDAEGLSMLGGVKLSRIRNMMSGNSPELPRDTQGLLANEAVKAWLEKRDCFLPTLVRKIDDDDVTYEDELVHITPIFLPVARDGSMFTPDTARSGTYRVGDKGSEKGFEDFQAALSYLQSMPVAKWRRPNAEGNWGIVSAIDWRRVDLKTLG